MGGSDMNQPAGGHRGLAAPWRDFRLVLGCLTRLPGGRAGSPGELGPALWAAPLVGLLVAGLTALAYWLALELGLTTLLAAGLAVALQLLLTGAFHEDGLADVADGFGGGRGAERKLAIMRDSRIGTYGVLTLILALLLKIGALASLARPELVLWTLLAANAAARAPLALVMRLLPPARPDGLGAGAGRPPALAAWTALALGVAVLAPALGFALGLGAALWALAILALVTLFWTLLSQRQIGGYTGDVLGALAATAEVTVLLVAVARL
jgi:adenosylcobinamide-GDP ribazoletransferase